MAMRVCPDAAMEYYEIQRFARTSATLIDVKPLRSGSNNPQAINLRSIGFYSYSARITVSQFLSGRWPAAPFSIPDGEKRALEKQTA
jgi:hypothetical protein